MHLRRRQLARLDARGKEGVERAGVRGEAEGLELRPRGKRAVEVAHGRASLDDHVERYNRANSLRQVVSLAFPWDQKRVIDFSKLKSIIKCLPVTMLNECMSKH